MFRYCEWFLTVHFEPFIYVNVNIWRILIITIFIKPFAAPFLIFLRFFWGILIIFFWLLIFSDFQLLFWWFIFISIILYAWSSSTSAKWPLRKILTNTSSTFELLLLPSELIAILFNCYFFPVCQSRFLIQNRIWLIQLFNWLLISNCP